MKQSTDQKPSFGASIGILSMLVAILVLGFAWKRIAIQSLLFVALFLIGGISLLLGYKWDKIQKAMINGLMKGSVAMIIMFLIGMIIGSWIECGTVPALIYYGLNILSPKIFLPAAFLICCITSLATGTSWGSAGTVGLALMGIGGSMGIPAPIIAGAVVSGSFFGDKLSPLSDTTNIAAATANVDIFDHIKAMLYTSVPAVIISLIMYTVVGLRYTGGDFDVSQIELVTGTLAETFNINIFVMLPAVIVLVLSLLKFPAIPSMAVGVIAGTVVSLVFQGSTFNSALTALNSGYTSDIGVVVIDTLLTRGGLQRMMGSISLLFIALTLGGVLEELGYLQVIVEKLLSNVKRAGTLVFATIFSCFLTQATICNTMVAIILNGTTFQSAYDKMGIHRKMLSRCLEEGSTLTAALIPWNTAGAYMASVLGVSTFAYLPYTFFNLTNILISIVLSYMGIFVFKSVKGEKAEEAVEESQAV